MAGSREGESMRSIAPCKRQDSCSHWPQHSAFWPGRLRAALLRALHRGARFELASGRVGELRDLRDRVLVDACSTGGHSSTTPARICVTNVLVKGRLALSVSEYVVLAPDGDLYAENYGEAADAPESVRWVSGYAQRPVGVPGPYYLLSAAPSREELEQTKQEAEVVASEELRRRSINSGGPFVVPPGGALQPVAGSAPVRAELSRLEGGLPGVVRDRPAASAAAVSSSGVGSSPGTATATPSRITSGARSPSEIATSTRSGPTRRWKAWPR